MKFYKQVLADICTSKSAFNGPFISKLGSNRLRLVHQLKKKIRPVLWLFEAGLGVPGPVPA